ncbi:nitroreductase family protein [Limibacter armeniacum]|uniref:nitroreductase family protein n=1 Tax=Limibacter armeniacum TaxID=466084 RepID=UPI002FE64FD5
MNEKELSINSLIERRWSPRAFSDRLIEPNKIHQLFKAASWAASSFNEQPWRFIYATKDQPEGYKNLLDCLVEFNQQWATSAPLLILSVASKKFQHNDTVNRHAWHDVGQAAATMAIQATELGLYMHQMAGFDSEKAQKTLGIPDEFEPVAMIAVGYIGDPNSLPDGLREKETAPRSRKSLEDFTFQGKWK